MLIEIYILFAIVSFLLFVFVIVSPSFLPDDSMANIFILPVVIVIFSALFFASYDLTTSTTITSAQNMSILSANTSRTVYEYETTTTYFTERAFSYMFLALAIISLILFIWEIIQQRRHLKG